MPRYMTAGTAPFIGDGNPSFRSIGKIARPILGMWVQSAGYDTKAEADALIQIVKDWGITDLILMADIMGSPSVLMSYADSCSTHITALRYDGAYPMRYMARQLHAIGCRIHAWWVIMYWYRWGDTTHAFTDTRLGAGYIDSSDASLAGMYFPETRAYIANVIGDFARNNPEIDAHNLDYIRTDGVSTMHVAQDITDLVHAIRANLNGHTLSMCTLATRHGELSGSGKLNQQPRVWVDNYDMDIIFFMGYEWSLARKTEQYTSMHGRHGARCAIGFTADNNTGLPDDTATKMRQARYHDVRDFVLFDELWQLSTWPSLAKSLNHPDRLDAYDEDIGVITKVTAEQGTSVTITIDGVDKVITWADFGLTAEQEPAHNKANAETALGMSLGPCYFNYNTDATTLYCGIGEQYGT